MSRRITIAAIQPALTPLEEGGDPREFRAQRVQTARESLAEAAERGATVACFPEHYITAGMPRAVAATWAEDETFPAIKELEQCIRHYGLTVVMGVLRRGRNGDLYNSAVVVEAGHIVGVYDKVHPTQEEQAAPSCVRPGAGFPTFRLSWGTIGTLICHDNSFVESARCLALDGAEVLFWPHVQSGWGDVAWDAVLRARAIDNGVYIVSSCFSVAAGRAWRPGMMLGRSNVVAPDGTILADAGHHPGMAVAAIDPDEPRLAHDFTRAGDHPFQSEMFADRRPDAYRSITAPSTRVPAEREAASATAARDMS